MPGHCSKCSVNVGAGGQSPALLLFGGPGYVDFLSEAACKEARNGEPLYCVSAGQSP